MIWVRCLTSTSRVRQITAAADYRRRLLLFAFYGNQRHCAPLRRSQIASASAISFLWRLTNVFPHAGGMRQTSWPIFPTLLVEISEQECANYFVNTGYAGTCSENALNARFTEIAGS
jgi:hypothetical protein